ncbi:unnamed protein product [Peniophora sp. CBMAI 1063]|nr:unnamed protein product [Peniophora sp. CBMAI 1063]
MLGLVNFPEDEPDTVRKDALAEIMGGKSKSWRGAESVFFSHHHLPPGDCYRGPQGFPWPYASRSGMATVASLPPELTTSVFLFLAATHSPEFYTYVRKANKHGIPILVPIRREGAARNGWLNVTFVCRAWREIAINCSAMWTDLNGTLGPSWLKCFIERSKDASVSVRDFHELAESERSKPLLDDVLPRVIHRTRILEIGHYPSPTIYVSLAQRAPYLEDLSLTSIRFHLLGHDDGEVHERELFAADAPLLRRFRLASCTSIPWSSVCLRNLRSLCLEGEREHSLDLFDCLDAIRGMHNLTQLFLYCQWHYIDTTLPPPDALALPSLVDLRFRGRAVDIVSAYVHLRLQNGTRLEMHCTEFRADYFAPLIAILTSHPTPIAFDVYDKLAVQARFLPPEHPWFSRIPTEKELEIYVSSGNGHGAETEHQAPLSLKLRWESEGDVSFATFVHNLCQPSMTSITSLRVGGDLWRPSTFTRSFRSLQRVDHLHIRLEQETRYTSLTAPMLALQRRIPSKAMLLTDPMLLPALKDIRYTSESFGVMLPEYTASDYSQPAKLQEIICELVEAREALGAPLRSLRMSASMFKADPLAETMVIDTRLIGILSFV